MAAGFLAATSLFLLLIFLIWRSERRGIEQQRATGLSATSWDLRSQWSGRSILPVSFSRQRMRSVDYARVTVGGVHGEVASAVFARPAISGDSDDRQVVRSGALEIIAANPLLAADQLRDLATGLSRCVVSSKVSGSDEHLQAAQVIVRIPAEHLDEARAQVRAFAKLVEQDVVDARDVTGEYGDQEAFLRNARADMPDSFLFFVMNAFVTNFPKTRRMGTRSSTAKPGPPESLARKVRTDEAHSRGLGSKKSSGRCSCVFS
jgi:hypothetical protein